MSLASGQSGMTIAYPSPSELRSERRAMGRGVPFVAGNRNRTSRNRSRRALRRRKQELNVTQWVEACLSPSETGAERRGMGSGVPFAAGNGNRMSRNGSRRALRRRKREPNVTRGSLNNQ